MKRGMNQCCYCGAGLGDLDHKPHYPGCDAHDEAHRADRAFAVSCRRGTCGWTREGVREPKRIQRKRTAGWKTPECSCGCGKPARYVGRPTKFGNPFQPTQRDDGLWVGTDENGVTYPGYGPRGDGAFASRLGAVLDCVRLFAELAIDYELGGFTRDEIRAELRGHDLVCWCPESQPCHADVLLELANGGVS